MHNDNLNIGLDIGTSKIRVVVLRPNLEGGCDVLGVGSSPSKGLRKGSIINIDAAVGATKEALHQASIMSGVNIKSANVSISGAHSKNINSRGIVAIRGSSVMAKDVERAMDSACAVSIPAGYKVLHVLPKEFTIDDHSGIKDPMGMSGVRLEVDVNIVLVLTSAYSNIVAICDKLGLAIVGIHLEQLASAEATLSDDEQDMGVVLIDNGGGTTNIAVIKNSSLIYSNTLQIGGYNYTRDLAIGLSMPEGEAERIKIEHGVVNMDIVDPSNIIPIPSVGRKEDRQTSLEVIASILYARGEEVYKILLNDLTDKGLIHDVGAGVVLTGGASSLLGLDKLASDTLSMSVRTGSNSTLGLSGFTDYVEDPSYSVALGLALILFKSREPIRSKSPRVAKKRQQNKGRVKPSRSPVSSNNTNSRHAYGNRNRDDDGVGGGTKRTTEKVFGALGRWFKEFF